jgi:hypothetical protein
MCRYAQWMQNTTIIHQKWKPTTRTPQKTFSTGQQLQQRAKNLKNRQLERKITETHLKRETQKTGRCPNRSRNKIRIYWNKHHRKQAFRGRCVTHTHRLGELTEAARVKPGDGETSNMGRSEGPDHCGMTVSPVVVPVAVTLTAFKNNSGSPPAAAETLIQNSGSYLTRELWYQLE